MSLKDTLQQSKFSAFESQMSSKMEMDVPNMSVSKSSTFWNYENKNVQQSFCA